MAPGVPSRDQKGSGNQVREPNEDPKGAQVHPEEPPGRPRGSSAEHFRVCGHLEILTFMLRKSTILDVGHFTGSGRSRDPPRKRPGDATPPFPPPAPTALISKVVHSRGLRPLPPTPKKTILKTPHSNFHEEFLASATLKMESVRHS